MAPQFRLLVSRSDLKGWEVILRCSYRSTCLPLNDLAGLVAGQELHLVGLIREPGRQEVLPQQPV